VGFEPTIPLFDWVKTFHALDRATTVIVSLVFMFIKSARNRWGRHVEHMGMMRNAVENIKGMDLLEDLDLDGRLVLSRVLVTIDGVCIGEYIY
jgi:hypothetical protein